MSNLVILFMSLFILSITIAGAVYIYNKRKDDKDGDGKDGGNGGNDGNDGNDGNGVKSAPTGTYSCSDNTSTSTSGGDDVDLDHTSEPEVSPGTGVGMWVGGSEHNDHPWINLAFKYLGWSDLYDGDKLDWTKVEETLDSAKDQGCQAIIRVRALPDDKGTDVEVPDFVKNSSGYDKSNTPDWSSKAMRDMVMDSHKAFVKKYNDDPRLYLYQVGFGYWGEFHLSSGPVDFEKGKTFPTDEYVKSLFDMLAEEATILKWAVSIDIADTMPDVVKDYKTKYTFGVFNDTILQPGGSKEANYKKLRALNAESRGETQINGGEFGNDAPKIGEDELDELDEYNQEFKTSYIMYNRQFAKSTPESLEEASIDMGYNIEVSDVKENQITVGNSGIAPVYYDIFMHVDGKKCKNVNLNLLKENTSIDITFDKVLKPSTKISFKSNDNVEIPFVVV